MAPRLITGLTAGALLAALAAGCGSASSSTSSGPSHTIAASSAPATSATASSTSTTQPAPATAPGFARYQGTGFSFVAPAGLKPAPDGGISGLPSGASAETLTSGGRSLVSTNTQIMEAYNPRLRTDVSLGEVATSLEAADANNPSEKDVHTSLSTMTVPGAEDVRTVSESYVAADGPHAKTLFHRTWLMVMPRPGVLMDLVVVVEPRRGGTLDPATVLDSFQLGS
jgi:hypothetical protein